jgi:hypothetical protein
MTFRKTVKRGGKEFKSREKTKISLGSIAYN